MRSLGSSAPGPRSSRCLERARGLTRSGAGLAAAALAWSCVDVERDLTAALAPPPPEGRLELPRDAGYLADMPIQWWYWNGHLWDENRREYGFQVVAFTFRQLDGSVKQEATFAITDIDEDTFHFESLAAAGAPVKTRMGFELVLQSEPLAISVTGDGTGQARLVGRSQDHALEHDIAPAGPAAVHFDGSARPFSFGGWTYYYSYPLQQVSGTLTLAGDAEPLQVTGQAWFDRQYGALAPLLESTYAWIGAQLEDGRQLMIFDAAGDDFAAITSAAGETRELAPGTYELCWENTRGKWRSGSSQCVYPLHFRIEVPDEHLDLRVTPAIDWQEVTSGQPYWEGKTWVTGSARGRAYLEVHGWCEVSDEAHRQIAPLCSP